MREETRGASSYRPQDRKDVSYSFIITADLQTGLAVAYANRSEGTIDAADPAGEHTGQCHELPNGGVFDRRVAFSAEQGRDAAGSETWGSSSQLLLKFAGTAQVVGNAVSRRL